jgi:hypothetical protein
VRSAPNVRSSAVSPRDNESSEMSVGNRRAMLYYSPLQQHNRPVEYLYSIISSTICRATISLAIEIVPASTIGQTRVRALR